MSSYVDDIKKWSKYIVNKKKVQKRNKLLTYPISGPSNVPSRQIPFPEPDDPAEYGFNEHHPHLEC